MADNDYFPIPSTLPDGDAGNKVRFLKRTTNGTEEGVQAIALVDPTNPEIESTIGANGLEVEVKASVLPTGGATSAAQVTGNASLASIDGKAPALVGGRVPVDGSGVTQPVSGPLTDAQLRATAVPVSGPLTDAQLRATAVPVSVASVPAHGVTGPVTDAEMRATPVPVSVSGVATAAAQTTGNASLAAIDGKLPALSGGKVPVTGPLTDTELRATAVPVSLASVPTHGVAGDVAHDAVDSGAPVKIGSRAIAHGTNPTAVGAGDRADLLANRAGIPFVMGGHPNVATLRVNYTSAQTNAAIITVAAGLKIVVTEIEALCDKANTVDVAVLIGFGATTTPTGAGVVLSHPGIAAGSGVVRGNGSGILGVGADGEDLRITSEAPTTGSLDVLVSYYTIDS